MDDQLSKAFAALADPTRRGLVARLAIGDATLSELAAPYDVSLQAISKHLLVLEAAGLVSRTRQAQRRPVHLEVDALAAMTEWIDRYQQAAEARYGRLETVLAELDELAELGEPGGPPAVPPHHPHHPSPDEGEQP